MAEVFFTVQRGMLFGRIGENQNKSCWDYLVVYEYIIYVLFTKIGASSSFCGRCRIIPLHENYVLLGYYAASYSVSLRTFRDNLSVNIHRGGRLNSRIIQLQESRPVQHKLSKYSGLSNINYQNTVIPRLTKIIRSGIIFLSRNLC